uniref:Putative secreted protein n=1 Tax=Ixodes ricinus TaxID=34613 RepID=A0A147BX10_IXORI
MRALRQALPWTWAFLLFLHAANGATETGAGPATPDIEKWLATITDETFYGQDTTSDTTPSLLGMDGYCLRMQFLQTGDTVLPNTLSLFYIDSSDKSRSSYRTNATLSIEVGKSQNTVTFTFIRANKTGLIGRRVQYKLLSDLNENHSTCSILVTSMGLTNCSFWVMYMGQESTTPDWCKPPTSEVQKCKVEKYTLKKPAECGVDSAEEEEEDEDDSEDSEGEEESEDEDEEGESEDEDQDKEEEVHGQEGEGKK